MTTMLGRLRGGFARLRYLRATLWLLPVEAAVLSMLGGVASYMAADSRPDMGGDYSMFVAFNLYLLAITAGRLGVGAWEATRESYSVLRPLALLLWLVTLAVTLIMPANLLFIGRSAMGYDHCFRFKCYALLPFIPPIITGVVVIAVLAPTSLLWFRLAKPRPPQPPRRPSRPAPE
jgi:hypothetical protein